MGFHLTDQYTNRNQPTACTPENAYPRKSLQERGLRYYCPGLGRWLSRDPAEEDAGLNAYGFVENTPVLHLDPFGLDSYYYDPPATFEHDGKCYTCTCPFSGDVLKLDLVDGQEPVGTCAASASDIDYGMGETSAATCSAQGSDEEGETNPCIIRNFVFRSARIKLGEKFPSGYRASFMTVRIAWHQQGDCKGLAVFWWTCTGQRIENERDRGRKFCRRDSLAWHRSNTHVAGQRSDSYTTVSDRVVIFGAKIEVGGKTYYPSNRAVCNPGKEKSGRDHGCKLLPGPIKL